MPTPALKPTSLLKHPIWAGTPAAITTSEDLSSIIAATDFGNRSKHHTVAQQTHRHCSKLTVSRRSSIPKLRIRSSRPSSTEVPGARIAPFAEGPDTRPTSFAEAPKRSCSLVHRNGGTQLLQPVLDSSAARSRQLLQPVLDSSCCPFSTAPAARSRRLLQPVLDRSCSPLSELLQPVKSSCSP